MAAKSDGVLKVRSDVAFTLLHNSELSGSVQGLHPGQPPDPVGAGDADLVNGESRCCGGGGPASRSPGPAQQRFSLWDCVWVVSAVAVYACDVGTDVWLSVDYYLQRDYWWFGLTLLFVLLGSCSVQMFSFRWFVQDCSTEDSAESVDGNKLLHGDLTAPQQRQAPAGTASVYSMCVWFGQSLIHIMQLGQIWR